MQHFRFDMQRNVSHTWSKTLEWQNHSMQHQICSSNKKSFSALPADEFGSSAACILLSNTFQPYVLHKYGKDPIIASRSQSGHDTKHLRSLLHQRYNCQKKGVTEQKRGRRPRQFSPSAFVVRPTQSHCRYNMCYAAVEFQSGRWKLSSQGSKIGSELTMN